MHERKSKPELDRRQYGRKIAAEVAAMAKQDATNESDLWDIRFTLAPARPVVVAADLSVNVPWLGRRLPVLGEIR